MACCIWNVMSLPSSFELLMFCISESLYQADEFEWVNNSSPYGC
jgi:hypothetical protein